MKGDEEEEEEEEELGVESSPSLTHGCGALSPLLMSDSPEEKSAEVIGCIATCLLYTSPSPRDGLLSRMPSSA